MRRCAWCKKNDLKPCQRQKWCILTVIGARFVLRMEDILDLDAEPYQLSASHQLLRGTAVDDPPDALTHHLGINANTPQPWYSRV